MSRSMLIVGCGTETILRGILPTCREVLRRSGRWPQHLYVLMADSDRRSQNRWRESSLPADQVLYVPLSVQQVKEALAFRSEEFKDCWRPEWTSMLQTAPTNGACMIPALGRLMVKAARPAFTQHLLGIQRRLQMEGAGTPEVFMIMNPVSGTSRGSIIDLPRFIQYVLPESNIHSLLVYPVNPEAMDPAVRRLFLTNFIEALRILENATTKSRFEVYMDPRKGWEERQGDLLKNIFTFDSRYGNRRLEHLEEHEFRLLGGLEELFDEVKDFLAGVACGDRLYDWFLGRIADVAMHRSSYRIAGHRTHCHSVHSGDFHIDNKRLRDVATEWAVARIMGPLAGAGQAATTESLHEPDFI